MTIILIHCMGTYGSNVSEEQNMPIVPIPNKENIGKYMDKIIRDTKRGQIIKYAILGSTAVAFPYIVYKLFFGDSLEYAGDVLDNTQLTGEILSLKKKYNEHFDADLLSCQWAKNTGTSALNTFISAGIGYFVWSVVEKLYRRYNCFENLECFVADRLRALVIFENLVVSAECLDKAYGDTRKNLEKEKNRFMINLNGVISAVESIVACMEYRLAFYMDDDMTLSQPELLIPTNLFDYTTDFCAQVQNELAQYSGVISFKKLSQDFVSYVMSVIKTFEFLEARVNWG